MPIYQLQCPQCQHQFNGMVFAGTRLPEVWVCPQCGSEQAQLLSTDSSAAHPLEASHGAGCPCCGGGGAQRPTAPKQEQS